MELIGIGIILGAIIWGVVEVIKHISPTWYDKQYQEIQTGVRSRLKAVEEKLGITDEPK